MFGIAVKLVPNIAATRLLCVVNRLRHSQPTVLDRRQLLSALHNELQPNQPATFLAAKFDGFLRE